MHRYIPAPGTPVWIRQRRWTIDQARLDRSVLRLDVSRGARHLTFLAPFDRPTFGPPRTRPTTGRRQQAHARCAGALAETHAFDVPLAAHQARIDLMPHQLEPALAILHGTRRLLIADEAGLGKTVQSGLIMAELVRRQPAARALVIAPAPLVDQWEEELRVRFGLAARVASAETFEQEVRDGAVGSVPWDQHGIWITSADFLKQRHIADSVPLSAWDAVVIDEAHTVAGLTDRQVACDEIGRRARHLILLTATPHAGDDARFHRLQSLGMLDLAGHDDLVTFQRTRGDIGIARARHVRWSMLRPSPDAARLYDALLAFERAVMAMAGERHEHPALLLLSVFRKRAASTVRALDETLSRRLDWLTMPQRAYAFDWLQPRLSFDGDDENDADEQAALIADIGLPSAKERTWIRRLRVLAAAALTQDPKVARVQAFLARTTEPVVIFTEFRHSLNHLQAVLTGTATIAVLHGGQSPEERRAALRQFQRGDSRVLLATDVAGQGLNLQHRARWVINLELPWNPARITQRIGRVDRIGQRNTVHASLLVTDHEVEAPVLTGLARRVLRAQRTLGAQTLTDVQVPTARATAAAVIAARPSPAVSAATIVPLCRGWSRRARVITRALVARRRWRVYWRGPDLAGVRPIVTAGALTQTRELTPRRAAVMLVDLTDTTGLVLERHVVAFSLGDRSAWKVTPLLLEALERSARRRMERRRRRVQRVVSVITTRLEDTERGIAAHLHALRCPEETQLGLFSSRARQALDAADADAHRAALAQVHERTRLERQACLSIERPKLVVYFQDRR